MGSIHFMFIKIIKHLRNFVGVFTFISIAFASFLPVIRFLKPINILICASQYFS